MPDKKEKSRMEAFREADENSSYLNLPDLEGAEYLASLLKEAGLVTKTGMGILPLTWEEIESWINVTGLSLTAWEILKIREMSEAYSSEYNQAHDPNRPAPYFEYEEIAVEEKIHKAKQWKNMLLNEFGKNRKEPKYTVEG